MPGFFVLAGVVIREKRCAGRRSSLPGISLLVMKAIAYGLGRTTRRFCIHICDPPVSRRDIRHATWVSPGMKREFFPAKTKRPPSIHPRIPNPCLQSPRSVADTLAGVPVRRDRRGWRGLRRKTSSYGFAENGFPPATRGGMTALEPSLHSLMPEKSAPGVPLRHTEWPNRMVASDVTSVRSIGEPTVNNRPVRPRQRSRSRGQKPPNGALRGVTYKLSYEAAFSALSDIRMADIRKADSLERPGVL